MMMLGWSLKTLLVMTLGGSLNSILGTTVGGSQLCSVDDAKWLTEHGSSDAAE